MNKNKILILLLSLLVPVIIYFYFLPWKTNTIYGDDLYIYKDFSTSGNLLQEIKLQIAGGKFRPVLTAIQHCIFNLFNKNLNDYYLFNVAVQSINTLLFALVLRLFLNSSFLSIAISLLLGTSRFCYYNMSQLYNGGALEGVAMTFFILVLYFLLKTILNTKSSASTTRKDFLMTILFANFSMYTHERYIVLFPFIMLVIILLPRIKQVSVKNKISLSFIAFLSIAINYSIKKFIIEMPFFMGTGGTKIDFSFITSYSFYLDGLKSIVAINSGPDYLIGLPFIRLPFAYICLVLIWIALVITSILFFIFAMRRASVGKNEHKKIIIYIFLSLFVLLNLMLVPAIVTIRIEQRWLQASYSVFIIMLVIAVSRGFNTKIKTRKFIYFILLALPLLIDHYYISNGINNVFMRNAEREATYFRDAIYNKVILKEKDNLYLFQKTKNMNTENEVKWALCEGYLFQYYQSKSKHLFFIDSSFKRAPEYQVIDINSWKPL